MVTRIFACIGIVLALSATYSSLRLSYADQLARSPHPVDVQKATRIAPLHTPWLLRWYDLVEAEGGHPPGILDQALATDPLNASIWIRAGLTAEFDRDFPRAERHLLQAAHVNHQFEPRWALANYYFRRGREAEFWVWFGRALERSYGDLRPLFTLAWLVRPDPALILARLEPGGPKVLRAYLDFMLETNRSEAAGPAAASLSAIAGREERATLINYITRVIDAHLPQAGLGPWNALCGRNVLPCDPLDPALARSITNGDFARPTLGAGFDWRTALVDGTSISRSPSPPFLRIEFSGRQPERCDLLWQVAPVLPSTRYALKFDHQSNGLRQPGGLGWRVTDAQTEAEIPSQTPELASESWQTGAAEFQTPGATRFVRFTFRYARLPGTTRAAGEFLLRSVRLEERR